jgi:hypothetical protein
MFGELFKFPEHDTPQYLLIISVTIINNLIIQ